MSKLTELEQVIGYEFNEQRLLQQALTHSSFANEKHMKKLSDNERLEFRVSSSIRSIQLSRRAI